MWKVSQCPRIRESHSLLTPHPPAAALPRAGKAQRSDHMLAAENVSALCSPTLRTSTKTSCISVSRSRFPSSGGVSK